MNDFASRLERQLVDAARREQRRARRPLIARRVPDLRSALPTVAALAAIAIVLLVLAPQLRRPEPLPTPGRPGPVPTTLGGNYTSGDVRLILDRRRYTLLIAGKDAVTGTVAAQGPVLILEDDGEGACRASTQPAQYRATFANGELRLQRLTEHCPTRARALEQPLTRDG